jgi:putative long chain acyl-CoA synthase
VLLARAAPAALLRAPAGRVERDLFEPGDAWLATSDLVRRDADGDFWFVDRIADVIRTSRGPIPSRPIEDTLHEMPAITAAVVYGAKPADGADEVPVAAIVLAPGAALDPEDLGRKMAARHPPEARPRFVRVVDSIPRTEGYRLLKASLRAEGIPSSGRVLAYDVERDAYMEREHCDER